MSDPIPVQPIYLPGASVAIDCSPAAQAERFQLLADLRRAYYSGVQSVTDRNRSVTYRSPADMLSAINGLVGELNACTAGAWPRRRPRVYYVPQVKDL